MTLPVGSPEVVPDRLSDPTGGEFRLVIRDIGWDGFEMLTTAFGNDGPRLAYLDGTVELMAPHIPHEESKKVLGRMIEELIVSLRIPAKALGSTTFKRADMDRGVEPDECYYLTNLERLQGQTRGDLDRIPPPDLVLEIEMTSSLLDKLSIYAGLGVPEVWQYDGVRLTILLLQINGSYLESSHSQALPFLPLTAFANQLEAYQPDDETAWFLEYRAWVREVVAPLDQL